jgi:predicted nicotinamide N-methyase
MADPARGSIDRAEQAAGEGVDLAAFVRRHTAVAAPPLVPEVRLRLAAEVLPVWEASAAALGRDDPPPPFWAFAWAGGQALARHLLDRPGLSRGRRALDVGAGGGLVAIAARLAGAAEVAAAEIDPLAWAAIQLNAELNDVALTVLAADPIGSAAPAADLVLVGDLWYERALAERLVPWLRGLAGRGAEVLVGDPGRTYLPHAGLEPLARYRVPTTLDLEGREVREAGVWRLRPAG